ncbi:MULTISPECIES: class I SAM-dependent methyltransferase [unclassified Mycobacterium]|uniref:class I SAM-dependent methyltransferase n=1 Tax=unclassified Mycobacterium TaxID=2642494 RepID=UPI0029C8213C|nr:MULTISPECIES: class I SAM-dependent methyltransferase [unclassified Mycobacterium]
MPSRQRLFRVLYRLGFTPWDGHPLSPTLRGLVEGPDALTPGRALDIGCGTGDTAIYLAKNGWQVTGVDYVDKPLAEARTKAAKADVSVDFVRADATRLGSEGVASGFGLIVDNGCLHGMSDVDRDAYAREVTTLAAPGCRLVIVAFVPGGLFVVPGISSEDVARRFTDGWTMLAQGDESAMDRNGKNSARHYVFARD